MNKTQIFDFVITLLGISIFVTTLSHLIFYISYYSFNSFNQIGLIENNIWSFLFGLIEYIILFPFSLILIFRTAFVIKLFYKPIEEEPIIQISISDKSLIYEVAIVIIGLLTIIYTLPDFVVEIDKLLSDKSQYFRLHRSEFILTIMKLVLGIFAIAFSEDIGKKIGEK